MRVSRLLLFSLGLFLIAAGLIIRTTLAANASQTGLLLSPNFQPRILSTSGESPLALRIFITAVKTDSRGRIITGPTSDPVKSNRPTEVPITVADRTGGFAGDGMGPIYVSLDSPFVKGPNGRPLIDRLGSDNLAPLVVGGQINPALAANNIRVIKDTHGKTSHLSASDLEALILYLLSLDGVPK